MINLEKGQNVKLTGLTKVKVGLSWDVPTIGDKTFDLDASCFCLNNGKCKEDDFIFYGHLNNTNKSVVHSGDNRTGAGDGDDEVISVDLANLPTDIDKLIFVITIDKAKEKNQNFGQVKAAKIHLFDVVGNTDVCKYDLSEDASIETCMLFAELYKISGEWKFKAVEQGYKGGLAELLPQYGLA